MNLKEFTLYDEWLKSVIMLFVYPVFKSTTQPEKRKLTNSHNKLNVWESAQHSFHVFIITCDITLTGRSA